MLPGKSTLSCCRNRTVAGACSFAGICETKHSWAAAAVSITRRTSSVLPSGCSGLRSSRRGKKSCDVTGLNHVDKLAGVLEALRPHNAGFLQDVLWRLPGDELVAAVAALPLTDEVVLDALVEGVDHTGEPCTQGSGGQAVCIDQGRGAAPFACSCLPKRA